MWPGVVVLVNQPTLTRENRHHHRREHFVDVAMCCDAPAASSAVDFEDDRLYTTSPGYGTPQHDGKSSPTVSLHNTRICEALTSTPPHPHKTVGPIYAVAAFVGEDDVLPLSVPPLSMQNSPVVSCNAVSLCEVDDSSDGRPSDDVLPWCGKRAGCGFPLSAGLLWWLVGTDHACEFGRCYGPGAVTSLWDGRYVDGRRRCCSVEIGL